MARPVSKVRKRVTAQVAPSFNREAKAIAGEGRKARSRFEKERDSTKGAVAAARSAVANTKLGGLKGPEGRQLRQEVASRQQDLAQALPGLLAPIQRDYKEQRADVRDALRDNSRDMQDEVDQQLSEVLQNRKEKRASVDAAYKEALRLTDESLGEDYGVPKTKEEWMQFEDALRKTEGVDVRAARKAVKRLQIRIALTKAGGW